MVSSLWRYSFIVASACCICLLLQACGSLSSREIDVNEADAASHTSDIQDDVDMLAQPLVARGETPGIVVGVLSPGGGMRFFGYGVADQKTGLQPNGDTLFPVGSLSKGFLGAVTATLVDEGVLSWNDTLEQMLPPDTLLSPDAKKITLLQLATHTSGLPRQPITFQTFRYFFQYLFTGKNFYRHLDEDHVFNYLADFKAPAQVETRYSNIGYGLLGDVLERRTGLSLEALLEQKLAQPLGLKSTGYAPDALPGYAARARGYAGDQPKFILRGRPVPDWHFTELMKGGAGVYSSAKDLLTFAAAHFSTETRLNTVLADTLKPLFTRPSEAPAIGWIVDDINGQHITYQVGLVAGYTSYLGLDVEHGTAVVVLENSFNWTDRIGHKLLIRMALAQDYQRRNQVARQQAPLILLSPASWAK